MHVGNYLNSVKWGGETSPLWVEPFPESCDPGLYKWREGAGQQDASIPLCFPMADVIWPAPLKLLLPQLLCHNGLYPWTVSWNKPLFSQKFLVRVICHSNIKWNQDTCCNQYLGSPTWEGQCPCSLLLLPPSIAMAYSGALTQVIIGPHNGRTKCYHSTAKARWVWFWSERSSVFLKEMQTESVQSLTSSVEEARSWDNRTTVSEWQHQSQLLNLFLDLSQFMEPMNNREVMSPQGRTLGTLSQNPTVNLSPFLLLKELQLFTRATICWEKGKYRTFRELWLLAPYWCWVWLIPSNALPSSQSTDCGG